MIIRTASDIQKALTALALHDVWAFDVETTGLNPRRDQLIGFSIACESFSAYVVLREYAAGALHEVLSTQDIMPLLEQLKTKKLVTHNGSFDTRFTYHATGVKLWPSIFVDTMLLVHTVNENRFNYGLKQLAAEIFGQGAVVEQGDLQASMAANGAAKGELYKADSNIITKYGRKDAELTYALYKHFRPLAEADNVWDFYCVEVNELYRCVTIPMELTGVPVDVPALQRASAEAATELSRIEASIQTQIAPHLDDFKRWYLDKEFPYKLSGPFAQKFAELENVPLPKTPTGAPSLAAKAIDGLPDCYFKRVMRGEELIDPRTIDSVQAALFADTKQRYMFNILSKDHLARLFFTKLKEKALNFTEKLKKPQIDDEFLALMAKKHKWAAELHIYNRLTKITSTYINRFLDAQENGIFYPQFHQHRTVSGRYSGDTQQLPRYIEPGGDEEILRYFSNQIRGFFISRPDWSFADFDYDSQEVKVFAHVAGDQGVKDIFARGDDFYSAVAIEAERLSGFSASKSAPNYLGKVAKPKRQKAKAYALGLAFNMSPYKLKFELDCSGAEAQQIYDGYFRAFPKLKEWLERSKEFACLHGYMVTQAGRKRRYPELKAAYAKHGKMLFDALELWKEYNDSPLVYAQMKSLAGVCKNLLNNSVNHQVQGLAASITNRAAIKCAKALQEAGLQAHICNVVHDQITVHCPDSELERVCNILQHSMETTYPISVPLTAPPSWGKNWGESKG